MQIESYVRLVLGVIVLIILVWILIRFRVKKHEKPDSLEILRERMEKGEITEEEYEAAKENRERK
jgi:putative membrane protein